eukprot:1953725-Alexandrium_andersonii.AAC.1
MGLQWPVSAALRNGCSRAGLLDTPLRTWNHKPRTRGAKLWGAVLCRTQGALAGHLFLAAAADRHS